MLINPELEDKFVIFVSKQFIYFNNQNPKAYSQFIELIGKPKSKMEYIDDLPSHIGWHQDRYIDYNTSEILELIYSLVEELKSLLQQYNAPVGRRIYLRDDIPKIDADILANIQRYDLFNSLSDADGVELNIYLTTIVDSSKKPKHGDIVVASILGEFTVKKLYLGEKIMLQPMNPNYKPIVINEENQLEIFGVVTHVIHET